VEHNGDVVLLDAAIVLGVVSVCLYLVFRAVIIDQEAGPRQLTSSSKGKWETTHYDRYGVTRVAVRKRSPGGQLLDEHVVAEIPIGDPGYDEKFLTAMATARERKALFESEDG
jgi:hypothetical protein